MKKASLVFMMVILIGSASSSAPLAFANPGVGMSVTPSLINSGGTFTITKSFSSNCDVLPADIPHPFLHCDPATVGSEQKEHSHLTFAVVEPPNVASYTVPSDSGICAGQTSANTGFPFFHLVAATPPPGTDPGADIHMTFSAQLATDLNPADHKANVKFIYGAGVPTSFTMSGPVIVQTHGAGGAYPVAGGFLPYVGQVQWLKDGIGPNDAGTTAVPLTTIIGGECDFVDALNNEVYTHPPDASDVVHVTADIVASPPVGGTIIPVDMTSLFVAGIFANAGWMVPTIGGVAGTALALFKVRRKQS